MATEISLEFDFRNQRFRDASKGLEAVARELQRAPEKLTPILRSELSRYLEAVKTSLQRRHSKPFNNPNNVPVTGEENLLRRSGKGLKGIRYRTRGGKIIDTVQGELTIDFPLSVHEAGATIRASSSKFLTIPLSAALDSRGIPLRARARDWDNTFVRQSRRGNLIIFRRTPTGIVPLYLLRRSVQLPPRLKAQETLNAGADYFIDTAIDTMARALLQGF